MQSKSALLFNLLLVLIFSSCYSSNDIAVKLTPTYRLLREMGMTAHVTSPIPANDTHAALASALGLEEFVVTHFLHRPLEYYYHEWKEGKRDSAGYLVNLKNLDDDAAIPTFLPKLDGESLFLYGRKKEGGYIVVADQNNNNFFDDDTAYIIERPIENNKTETTGLTFPTVRLNNLQ